MRNQKGRGNYTYQSSHKINKKPQTENKKEAAPHATNQAKTKDHSFWGCLNENEPNNIPNLLNDEQMKSFLFNGYLIIRPKTLTDEFHNYIYNTMENKPELIQSGNNILPALPALNQVYSDPNVSGALISIIGNNYIMQPHRAVHITFPGSKSQRWHRDSFWGYGRFLRFLKPRYVMAMYYPQKTTLPMGPTGIKPGTQYYSIDPKFYKGNNKNHFTQDNDLQDLPVVVEAGSVVIIHYDIIHKGMENNSNKNRYMFKFQFMRMEEPKEPTWNNTDPIWKDINLDKLWFNYLNPICQANWLWLLGNKADKSNLKNLPQDECNKLFAGLDDPNEWIRYYSAFTLSLHGHYKMLFTLLKSADEDKRIVATMALSSTPFPIEVVKYVEGMFLPNNSPELQQSLSYISSQLAPYSETCLLKISEIVFHKDHFTRFHAIEAIGIIGEEAKDIPDVVVDALISGLQDQEGRVRFSSALSLAQLKSKAAKAVPYLSLAMNDSNRYVQAFSLIALQTIKTPQAMDLLFTHLISSRYCPITTSGSTY